MEGGLPGLVVDGWMGGWRMESDSESMERGVGWLELGELGSRTGGWMDGQRWMHDCLSGLSGRWPGRSA